MPMPLSSHTNRTATLAPVRLSQPAVLKPARATAWLTEASPNEQITIASAGQPMSARGARRPPTRAVEARRRAPSGPFWSSAYARPTARGRCEAIVEVVGMTDSLAWPNTLCRPPAIGSVAAATTPRMTSRIGSRSSRPERIARAQ